MSKSLNLTIFQLKEPRTLSLLVTPNTVVSFLLPLGDVCWDLEVMFSIHYSGDGGDSGNGDGDSDDVGGDDDDGGRKGLCV